MALRRLLHLVQYNRDWPKYLYHRHTSRDRHPTLSFRLRNQQKILLNWDARFTLNEIYLDHVYDVPGVDLGRCRTILDIGANVGLFALYAASVAPEAVIHSFEPEPATFERLTGNLQA